MRRRDFITLLGGAAALPLVARAQQPAAPVIGFLSVGSPGPLANLAAAFRQGLKETGYAEGQNVVVEYRWAEGHYDRLPALAADLARRQVKVIAATGGTSSAHAAKAATTTIPVVFNSGVDPVKSGLVDSFNRPGGNLTGVVLLESVLMSKQLELLHELLPKSAVIAVLVNPNNKIAAESMTQDVQDVTLALGHQLRILNAATESGIDAALATLAQSQVGGLLVVTDTFFNSRREQIATLAARHSVPAIYAFREYPVAGGLMSYGANLPDGYRQVGVYVGRILQGAKPGDLPVLQPTKFELVINLKTAKVLGLTVPPALLARADEVIE